MNDLPLTAPLIAPMTAKRSVAFVRLSNGTTSGSSAAALGGSQLRHGDAPGETLRRRTGKRELVEGGRVVVEVEVRGEGGLLPARATMTDQVGDLGVQEVPLRHVGHALRGRYVIDPAPRGRYTLANAELVVDDPLGLAESRTALERRGRP